MAGEMRPAGVPKRMHVPQLQRDLRSSGVQLKEVADRTFGEGFHPVPPAAKQVRRGIVASNREVGMEKPLAPWVKWVPVVIAIFEARDPYLVALDVGDLEVTGLAAT